MTQENRQSADTHHDDIGKLVANLTQIVEKETKAFQSLLDALLDQQASILKGDTAAVALSNEKVEQIVAETRALERQRLGETQSLGGQLSPDSEGQMSLSRVIPLVEERYARRLQELREILIMLSQKIQKTNERNRFLLNNSLKFVDNCMRMLVESQHRATAYSRRGVLEGTERSLFSGVG